MSIAQERDSAPSVMVQSDPMELDTDLDGIYGRDVELPGSDIGVDDRITIVISGEAPGHMNLVLELDYEEIVEALITAQQEKLGDPDWDDLIAKAGAALPSAVLELMNDRGSGGFSADDITIDCAGEMRVFVTSLQGETLGQWADRAGRQSAQALLCSYPDNIVARLRPLTL